jgi:hypothetical protein
MKLLDFRERHFAPLLGLTPQDALFLQRELQKSEPAQKVGLVARYRGPGGGPDATPATAALMLVGVMAGGRRVEAGSRVERYGRMEIPHEGADDWTAEAVAPPLCPLTGAGSFDGALIALLADPQRAALVNSIKVRRDIPFATISGLDRDAKLHRVEFGRRPVPHGGHPYALTYRLNGSALLDLAAALQNEAARSIP